VSDTVAPSTHLEIAAVTAAPLAVIAVYAVAPLATTPWLGVVASLLAIGVTIPLATRRVRRVRHSDRPLLDAAAAIALFSTVLIIGFASMYYAVAVHRSGEIDGIETKIDALYFTVTTAATVGFGDITADGQLARLLVTVNMVFNIVALGATVRLVGWAARQRIDEGAGIARRGPDAT
jgi:voltage-gated potassium channel